MDTLITVDLPLPLDVSCTLMSALGAAYPNAVVRTDGPADKLTFAVSDTDRAAQRSSDLDEEVDSGDGPDEVGTSGGGERGEMVVPAGGDVEAFLSSIRDGTFGFTVPEWFSKTIYQMAQTTLDEAGGSNYVEMTLHDQEGGEVVVIAARSKGQTPHQLRDAAEKRAERYAAELRRLGVDLDSLEP